MPNAPTATLTVTPFNLLTHSPISSPSSPFALNVSNGLLLTVSVSVCGAALSFSPISLSYSVSGSPAVGVYPCDSLGNALSQTPLPESSPEHIVADMYRHGLSLASEVPCADGTHYFIILGSGSVPLTGLFRTKLSHAFRPALTDENAYIKAERPLVADYPIGPASLSADLGHGRHSLSMPLLSISNDLHEFALSAVWLSHCRTETAYGPSALPAGLPAGWKWSFQRWLLPNGSEYALVDASGLRHRFVRPDNADVPSGVYFDPSGTRLILTVGASQSVIEGPSGDRLIFDASGNLTEVRVKKGSEYATQTIAYSDGLPAALSLSDDVAITFVYGASSVTAQSSSGEAVSLAWSSAGVQATDAAGISVSAAFDSAGSLSSVSSGQLSMAVSSSNALLSSVSLSDLSQNPLRQASFARDGSVIRVSTTLYGSSATQTVRAFLLGQDGGIGSSWEEIGGRIENAEIWLEEGARSASCRTGWKAWDDGSSGPYSVDVSGNGTYMDFPSGIPFGFVYFECLADVPCQTGPTTLAVTAACDGPVAAQRTLDVGNSSGFVPIALPFRGAPPATDLTLLINFSITSVSGHAVIRNVRYYRSADPVSEDCSDAVNGAASFPAEGDFPSLYPLGTLPFSYYDSYSAQITGSARFSKGDIAASIVWNGSHPSEILLWSDEGSALNYKISSPAISEKPISAIRCAIVEKCHSWGPGGDIISVSAQYIQAGSPTGFVSHRFSKDGEYNAVAKEDRAFSQNLVPLWANDPLADLRETYETDVWGHLLWTETKHHPGQPNEKVRLSEQKTISDDGRHATSVATPISGSASRTDSYTYSDISDVTSSKIGGLLAVSASYLSGHLLSSVTQTAGENGPAFSNALGYSGGELYSMTTGGQTTLLARDAEGNVSSVSRDNSQIASYSVSADSIGRIVRATSWANGSSTVERCDRHGRKESLAVDGTERASWVYEDPGMPIGGAPSSAAPLKGIGYKSHQGSSYIGRLYQYDAYGRESSITEGTVSLSYIRPTIPPGEVTGFDFACDRVELRDSGVLQRAEIVGEAFGASAQQGRFRKTMLNGKNTFEQTRSWSFPDDMTSEIVVTNGALNVEGQYYRELDFFRIAGSKFTGFVESESFEYGVGGLSLGERHMTYSWDGNGMLSGISSASNGYGFSQSFSYDSFGRLVSEAAPTGIVYSYSYDARGNIQSKVYEVAGWPVGSWRTYDSKDRLTAMTDFPGANAFAYDPSGYPTRYKNKDVSWDGPMMTGYGSVSYAYDGLGRLRAISDPSRSVSLSYAPDDRLMRMAVSASNATYQLDFIYGTDGIVGFMIGSDVYIYHKNILGDIVAIYKNGALQAQYRHDAWGNCLVLNASGVPDTSASSAGNLNPFRYRGAFYDASSGLYLMGSRPYDPDVGRFICPDDPSYLDPTKIGGLNLYAYCLNNPVMYVDQTGHFGIPALIALLLTAFLAGGTAQLAANALSGSKGNKKWVGVAGTAIGSMINIAFLLTSPYLSVLGLLMAAFFGAAATSAVNMLETTIRGDEINLRKELTTFAINFAANFIGNFVGTSMVPINPGHFQPQRFLSVFAKKYGQRLLSQIAIGAFVDFYGALCLGYFDKKEANIDYDWYWHWIYE